MKLAFERIQIPAGQMRKVDLQDTIAFTIENVDGNNGLYVETTAERTDICLVVPGDQRVFGSEPGFRYDIELWLHGKANSTEAFITKKLEKRIA